MAAGCPYSAPALLYILIFMTNKEHRQISIPTCCGYSLLLSREHTKNTFIPTNYGLLIAHQHSAHGNDAGNTMHGRNPIEIGISLSRSPSQLRGKKIVHNRNEKGTFMYNVEG